MANVAEIMLDAFYGFLIDREEGRVPYEEQEPTPPAPLLFEDEIRYILYEKAISGFIIRIESTDGTRLSINSDGYGFDYMVDTIYTALEDGSRVTIDGTNILDL